MESVQMRNWRSRYRRQQIAVIRAASVVESLRPHQIEMREAYNEACVNLHMESDMYLAISTENDLEEAQ